ncbi:hypothetical protein NW757_012230 [Fusarium falciforme]|nr:hypothetical protein NW757_012230 [Fusarium falciforme]
MAGFSDKWVAYLRTTARKSKAEPDTITCELCGDEVPKTLEAWRSHVQENPETHQAFESDQQAIEDAFYKCVEPAKQSRTKNQSSTRSNLKRPVSGSPGEDQAASTTEVDPGHVETRDPKRRSPPPSAPQHTTGSPKHRSRTRVNDFNQGRPHKGPSGRHHLWSPEDATQPKTPQAQGRRRRRPRPLRPLRPLLRRPRPLRPDHERAARAQRRGAGRGVPPRLLQRRHVRVRLEQAAHLRGLRGLGQRGRPGRHLRHLRGPRRPHHQAAARARHVPADADEVRRLRRQGRAVPLSSQRQPSNKTNRPQQAAEPPSALSAAVDDPTTMILQPETRPISQDQLVAEVKGIYAGLVMVETKCIEVDNAQSSNTEANSKLNNEQWQALIALHRTLLHEHHDFFLASQHPSASAALRRLASKYAMPARMWRHGIHSFLELLRHRLPASLEHMLTFLYLAYSMMALLYETVPAFEDTWIECLGDLGRYRMAIEDDDIRDRETWTHVSRHWYSKASDKSPTTGRLYHHLAILARPNALQQLYYYTKSLCVPILFSSARESIMTLFDPVLSNSPTRLASIDAAFVRVHGILFSNRSRDKLDEAIEEVIDQLDGVIGRSTKRWLESGYYIGIALGRSLLGYGSESNVLMRASSKNRDETDLAMEGSSISEAGPTRKRHSHSTILARPNAHQWLDWHTKSHFAPSNTNPPRRFSSGLKNYRVKAKVGDHQVDALADTGAQSNFISPQFAKKVGLVPDKSAPRRIQLPGGKQIVSPGNVKVPFSFQGELKKYVLDCWIIPGCTNDLVLSRAFLSATKTLTEFKSRVKESMLNNLPKRLRLNLIGNERQRLWGSLNGRSALALPDTGSDVMLVSAQWAKENKLEVDCDSEHRLELEVADGSTVFTAGIVHNAIWTFGDMGEDVYCDFYVLEGLSVDVVFSNDFVFELDVFSEYCHLMVHLDELPGILEFCHVKLISKFGPQLASLEKESINDLNSPNARKAERNRRDRIRDAINALDPAEQEMAWEAERRRRLVWDRHREQHERGQELTDPASSEQTLAQDGHGDSPNPKTRWWKKPRISWGGRRST